MTGCHLCRLLTWPFLKTQSSLPFCTSASVQAGSCCRAVSQSCSTMSRGECCAHWSATDHEAPSRLQPMLLEPTGHRDAP